MATVSRRRFALLFCPAFSRLHFWKRGLRLRGFLSAPTARFKEGICIDPCVVVTMPARKRGEKRDRSSKIFARGLPLT